MDEEKQGYEYRTVATRFGGGVIYIPESEIPDTYKVRYADGKRLDVQVDEDWVKTKLPRLGKKPAEAKPNIEYLTPSQIRQREQEKQPESPSEAYENSNQKNLLAKSIEKNKDFLSKFARDIQNGESKKLGENFEMVKNDEGRIFLKTTLLGQDKILTFNDNNKMLFGNNQEDLNDIRDLDLDTLKTLKDNFNEVARVKTFNRKHSGLSR